MGHVSYKDSLSKVMVIALLDHILKPGQLSLIVEAHGLLYAIELFYHVAGMELKVGMAVSLSRC
jgi:hypothetical protein